MGLLDEAIREHLELKRRSGADPTAVEREEMEALAPVFPDEEAQMGGDYAGLAQPQAAESGYSDAVPVEGHRGGDVRLEDFERTGQDTAELDMQAVLEEDWDFADAVSPVGPVGSTLRPEHTEGTLANEPLEWQQPDEPDSQSLPADIPGQERLSFE
jgi:hypothetical protein